MSRSWAGGSTSAWRKTRAYVLERDGHVCRAHNERMCADAPRHTCTGKGEQAHHVRGRAITGDDPRYIVASCQPCNRAMGEPDVEPTPRPLTNW